MKDLLRIMLSVLLITSISSCNDKSIKESVSNSGPLAFKTISVSRNDSAGISLKYVVDLPVSGPDSLVTAINKEISYILGDSTRRDMTEKGVEEIADQFVDNNIKEIKLMNEESGDDWKPTISNEITVKVNTNPGKYITMESHSFLYMGGVHGISNNNYFTFSKESSRKLELSDMFASDKMEELKSIVMKNLISQYYNGEAPDWEEEFFNFNLPSQSPAIVTDGIIFCYGAYEIDCYAAGLPYCVIPFEDLENLMTPEAKALIAK